MRVSRYMALMNKSNYIHIACAGFGLPYSHIQGFLLHSGYKEVPLNEKSVRHMQARDRFIHLHQNTRLPHTIASR